MSFAGRAKNALDVTSTVVLTVAAGALAWNLFRTPEARSRATTPRPKVESVSGLSIEAAQASKRSGDSAIAIVEFSDFECPFCAQHARDTYPSIRRNLLEPRLAAYVALAFPLERIHPHARKASEAAECAARQGRYWEMHERLFASPTALAAEGLSESAKAVGLDSERFQACLAGEAAEKVAADIAVGRRLGVNSTPTFFVGLIRPDGSINLMKRLNGVVTFDDFRDSIAEVSKTTEARADAGQRLGPKGVTR
jgi:NhaA family Na+:H+ antiporter